MSKIQRAPRRPVPVLMLLGLSLLGGACQLPPKVDPAAEEQIRARVQLGRGLRYVQVDAALLDTNSTPLRAQVDLSSRAEYSGRVRGYFQWKDVAGINLGGTAAETRTMRSGSVTSFTSYAPSPAAFQYVFIAQDG